MTDAAADRLPSVIWVASRPPRPPFSGITSATLCGLTALLEVTPTELVTFAEPGEEDRVAADLRAYWGDRLRVHVVAYGPPASPLDALRAGRFQFGLRVERSAIRATLARLEWQATERLLIFDDVVLAPLAAEYGENAVLSPHDCMSAMFRSHLALARPRQRARLYTQYRTALAHERGFYHRCLLVHVITQRDRVLLQDVNPRARYHVVPNEDALNPGLSAGREPTHDVLLWADLRIASSVRGTRAFLASLGNEPGGSAPRRLIVIGRLPEDRARTLVGPTLHAGIEYSPTLEDDRGELRSARIMVVPDVGGAGMKNRCVNVLSSGLCLACTYEQMEGLEAVCDIGAINATDAGQLATHVASALQHGRPEEIAAAGAARYEREYGAERIRSMWHDLVRRAACIRERATVTTVPPVDRGVLTPSGR